MGNPHASLFEALEEFFVRKSPIRQIDVENVRADTVGLRGKAANPGDAFRQAACVPVVLRESIDHPFQRNDSRGRDDSGLAHSASKHLPDPAGPSDEFPASADHGSDRRGEPLREADVHRVGPARQFANVHTQCDGGVEDPGAVEVNGDPPFLCSGHDGRGVFGGEGGAVAAVVRVFQTNQTCVGKVDVLGTDGGFDLLQTHRSVRLIGDDVGEDAAQRGHPARLVQENVRAVSQDDLLAAGAVGENAGEIPHRAADDQERRFHSEEVCGYGFEAVDRGVLGEDVIAEIGLENGPAHLGGGQGHGIAAQIDHGHFGPPGGGC